MGKRLMNDDLQAERWFKAEEWAEREVNRE